MAEIVLGLGTGHASTLGSPPSQVKQVAIKDQTDPRIDYAALLAGARPGIADEITEEKLNEHHQACLKGVERLKEVLDELAPDVLVIIGDDQHEQFLDDNLPMLSIFHGAEMPALRHVPPGADAAHYRNVDTRGVFPGEPDLANHLLRSLCTEGFDMARCDRLRPEVGLGHAFVNPYRRYLPDRTIPMIPLMVNTYFPPNNPTPSRCYALGRALRDAIEDWDSRKRVAIMGSGGLSHQIIDEELDHEVLDAMMKKDAERLGALPAAELIRGTSEIRNWIVAAGACEPMQMTLVDYVPYYRSPAGTGCAGGFAYWC